MTPFVGYVIAMCLVFSVACALMGIPERDVPPGSSMGE
jgi:hypothetical protein